MYDKKKTPTENLALCGLISNVNSQKYTPADPNLSAECPGFVGYAEKLEPHQKLYQDKNSKRKILTEFEIQYIEKNINAHGDDFEAMFKDIKVNDMQYTAQKLERLCKKYYSIQTQK